MTDKLRQAAEMALSALEKAVSTNEDAAIRQSRAIYYLRQALAEPDTGIDRGAWDGVEDVTQWLEELRGNEKD